MSKQLVGVVYGGSFATCDVPLPSGRTASFERDGEPVELSESDAAAVLTNEDFRPAKPDSATKPRKGSSTAATGQED